MTLGSPIGKGPGIISLIGTFVPNRSYITPNARPPKFYLCTVDTASQTYLIVCFEKLSLAETTKIMMVQ